MKKEKITRNTIVIIVLMIVIGVGVILSNTITPWLGEVNRDLAVRDLKTDINSHTTQENNELGSAVLSTFKDNRAFGKSEHYNITQLLSEILNSTKNIERSLANGTA